MYDSQECSARDPELPEIVEVGTNPGWHIRVGVSREFVEILAETDEQGIWFETEAKMDAYVQRRLADRSSK